MIAANVADYRELARRRLPRVLFDYLDGGSYAETTLARNSEDFKDIYLRQRVLKDVSNLHMATEVLGQQMSMPLVLSPVGMSGMYWRRGEVPAAVAARKAGLPMCLSSMSICDVEETTQGGGAPIWFQLYVMKDRGYMESLMARAVDQGCPVLAFTVDLPMPGSRYRDARNGLNGALPPWESLKRGWDGATHLDWVWDVWMNGRPHVFGNIGPAIPEAKSSRRLLGLHPHQHGRDHLEGHRLGAQALPRQDHLEGPARRRGRPRGGQARRGRDRGLQPRRPPARRRARPPLRPCPPLQTRWATT